MAAVDSDEVAFAVLPACNLTIYCAPTADRAETWVDVRRQEHEPRSDLFFQVKAFGAEPPKRI